MTTQRTVPKVCENCGAPFMAFPLNAGRFCSRKCYWAAGGNNARKGYRDPRLDPTEEPNEIDWGWAAGVYEGEGTCHGNRWQHKDGTFTYNPALRVNQVDPWLCNRLRALFGGSVRLRHNKGHGDGRTGDIIHSTAEVIGTNIAPRPYEIYEWNLNGDRARDFLRTIYPRLSPRRRGQVDKAFGRETHTQ